MTSQQDRILLEVCLSTVEDARLAERCGADRIELNRALETGGLTPSTGTLSEVKAAVNLPVIVMIRPRPGDFCYSEAEVQRMLDDIDAVVQLGPDGLAFGVLTADGRIHREHCARLVARAAGRETVFHRAFDFTPDPASAIEQLIDLGVSRVLTSGQQPTAQQGAECIASLVRRANGRIEVLPGAGIGPENVRFILETTGCRQVHGSFRRRRGAHPPGQLTLDAATADGEHVSLNPMILKAVRRQLDAHQAS